MTALDTCNGSCSTFSRISDRICVSNKMEDEYLNILDLIARRNESETLARHTSCDCKCNFDGRKCNSNQKWNKNKYQCGCEYPRKNVYKKVIFGILLIVLVKMFDMKETLLTILDYV